MTPFAEDDAATYEGPAAIHVEGAQVHTIRTGLEQRGQLARLLVHDLATERRTIAEGLIPPDVLAETPGWSASLCSRPPDSDPSLLLSGAELVRNADRSWTVLADRTSLPYGLGLLAQAPWGEESPFTEFSRALREELDRRSPNRALLYDPRAISPDENLSSDLVDQDAHAAAEEFGLELLTPADLAVHQGRLVRTIQPPVTPDPDTPAPDLLIRYNPATALDPLEPHGRLGIGIPGLGALHRQGTVEIANPPGAAVLANPALANFLPRLARHFLSEDLILPSVTTYWCGDRVMCSHVIAHVSRLVLRSVASHEIHDGRTKSIRELADLCALIADEPWDWVGQEPVEPDAVQLPDGNFTPVMLRGFAVGGESWHALAGGLAFIGELDDRHRLLTHVHLAEDAE
ncbi:MAG TPA: circularly permuted type 2 ATP-grasp protein [Actinomycetales bacterium]|nr:circularly permuted type 2 ATP-grasp protein [Actinomycetales bacterium]